MRIALIGLPGSGKSTVGRALAQRRALAFADTDHALEARLDCSIAEFFEREGEGAFRNLEEAVIDELTRSTPDGCVLATGGGAVLRAANRQNLRSRTTVCYLECSPQEIATRLRSSVASRPLLHGLDPLLRLEQLLHQRDAFYRQTAHHVVALDGLTLMQAVQALEEACTTTERMV